VSLRVIKELLGHRFLASTEVYSYNQPGQLAQAVASLPAFD
jgi:site-specific recombinase XerD